SLNFPNEFIFFKQFNFFYKIINTFNFNNKIINKNNNFKYLKLFNFLINKQLIKFNKISFSQLILFYFKLFFNIGEFNISNNLFIWLQLLHFIILKKILIYIYNKKFLIYFIYFFIIIFFFFIIKNFIKYKNFFKFLNINFIYVIKLIIKYLMCLSIT